MKKATPVVKDVLKNDRERYILATGPTTAWWGKNIRKFTEKTLSMLKIDYIALCNIVANKKIVPELIQNEAQPSKIAKALCQLIDDKNLNTKIVSELGEIKEKLSDDNLRTDLSTLLIDMLNNKI